MQTIHRITTLPDERSMVGHSVVDRGVGVGHWRRGGVDGVVGDGVDRLGERLAVLVKLGLGQERIEERISVERVERWSLGTVDRVPGLTSEEVLVEQSSVGTDEASAMRSVSAVLADSVGLDREYFISY